MIAFFVVLIVILTVSFSRIRFMLTYSVSGFAVMVKIGFVTLFSTNKKKKPKRKKKGKRKEKPAKKEKPSKKSYVREIILALSKTLVEIRRAIRIDSLNIDFVIAGDDPYDTALHYAGANILVSGLLSVLHEMLRVKRQNISIQLDFEKNQPQYNVQVRISTSIGRVFILCIRFVWEIWKIKR